MRLSPDQLNAFRQAGFLLASGLIEPGIARRAYDRLIARTQNLTGASQHQFVHDRAVRACFTPEVISIAQQLAGPDIRIRPPFSTYVIIVSPHGAFWEWPQPHIDHALEKDLHKTFPAAFHIGCLIYLNEVAARSGATVVWPGSHLQIEELAGRDRKQYEYRATVNHDLGKLALADPVEVTSDAGDVLFYHHFLAHAGSENTGSQPRIALNHKW
jgi:phytanoyl-CoA dioxygenase PhyH